MTDRELQARLVRLADMLDDTGRPASASVVRSAIRRLGELGAARAMDDAGDTESAGKVKRLFSRLFGGSDE